MVAPENLCFIREGQGWSECGSKERAIWSEKMEGVVGQWIAFLRDNPLQAGFLPYFEARVISER